jgi:hypothetical protein
VNVGTRVNRMDEEVDWWDISEPSEELLPELRALD